MFVKSAVIISMCIGNYAVCFVDVLVRDGPLEKLWGVEIFEQQEFFFRHQIPCMNIFLGYSMNIF